jgi:toxin ParE1/3/4
LAIRSRKPIWTTAARADLIEDHAYIARENPFAADHFILDLYARVQSFAAAGLTGVNREEFGEEIRSMAYRERLIFFRINEIEMTVLRVLHGHQHVSSDDFTGGEH